MKKLFKILEIVLVIVLLFTGSKIGIWLIENNKSKNMAQELGNAVKKIEVSDNEECSASAKYEIDFKSLKEKNSDVVAWIKVNNTNVEYPVVQTNNNEYYLSKSFDKSNNSAGWVFADYRNKFDGTDKNIIVYGHNRKDRSMFGSLQKALTNEWTDNPENLEISFYTENEKCTYKIFSIYTIEAEDYYISTEFDDYMKFLNTIKNRSYKNFETELNENSKILTLSTCNVKNYRTVIHAVKID